MNLLNEVLKNIEEPKRYIMNKTKDRLNSLVKPLGSLGQLEDLSIKTHTRNPVPLIAWGKKKEDLLTQVHSIQDIAPVLLRFHNE